MSRAIVYFDVIDKDGFGSYGMKLHCETVAEAEQSAAIMRKDEHFKNVQVHEMDYLPDEDEPQEEQWYKDYADGTPLVPYDEDDDIHDEDDEDYTLVRG